MKIFSMCGGHILNFFKARILFHVHFLVEEQNKLYLMGFPLLMCDLTLKSV